MKWCANGAAVGAELPSSPLGVGTGKGGRGLPAWLPLLVMLAAFALAVIVGVRVCPVLSILLFPPAPPLPPGDVKLITEFPSGGIDYGEWLYGTDIKPCEVVAYYQDRVGDCGFDIDSGCGRSPDWGLLPRDGQAFPVAACQGVQRYGPFYSVRWTVRIAAGYTEDGNTHIRITRDVGD